MVGGGVHNWEKYLIDLFHDSGRFEQFEGVLFFGGQIYYFGEMG